MTPNACSHTQFVDCTSCDSFLNPRVYCIADNRGFKHLYPSTEMASAYTNRHLRHIRSLQVMSVLNTFTYKHTPVHCHVIQALCLLQTPDSTFTHVPNAEGWSLPQVYLQL